LHGVLVGHVNGVGFRGVGPRRIDFVRGFLRVGFGAADGGDMRALFRETNSNGMTDTTACTGDHGNLVFESHRVRDHIIKKLRFETADRTA
jgi:hypothetical protein